MKHIHIAYNHINLPEGSCDLLGDEDEYNKNGNTEYNTFPVKCIRKNIILPIEQRKEVVISITLFLCVNRCKKKKTSLAGTFSP